MVQDPRSWPWFVRASLLLTRTLVVIAVLNGILGVVWMWRDSRPRSQLLDQYGIDRLLTSYPGWTATDLEALLFEDGTVSEYEPLTEFSPQAETRTLCQRRSPRISRDREPAALAA